MLNAGSTSVCRTIPNQKRRVNGYTSQDSTYSDAIKIIWMLLSICGTPMRTFNMMGINSEKLFSCQNTPLS
jgi:hypothetical protein